MLLFFLACYGDNSGGFANIPMGNVEWMNQINGQSNNENSNSDNLDTIMPIVEGPAFSFEKRRRAEFTNIWSNLVPIDEDIFLFSTVQMDPATDANRIAVRYYSKDLTPLTQYEFVSEPDDVQAGVADHKVLMVDDKLYFAISGRQEKELLLVKTDLDGNRLDSYQVQDQYGSSATNDMHLFVVEDEVCVRWGTSGYYKSFQCFTDGLTPTSEVIVTEAPQKIPQLGATVQVEDEILTFTGDEAQRNLILTHYDLDYEPQAPFAENILSSENNDWNWFPSGVIFHPVYRVWFIAYTTMEEEGLASEDSMVNLLAYTEDFQLIDHRALSNPGCTRPSLALVGDSVIIGYDNERDVILERWDIIVPNQ